MKSLNFGVDKIASARQKQIDSQGYSLNFILDNPDFYENGQLQDAAYKLLSKDAQTGLLEAPLNWDRFSFYGLCIKPLLERLEIAGAFLAAEIDRIERSKNPPAKITLL